MAVAQPPDGDAAAEPVAVGVRAVYNAVAGAYDAALRDELDGKPLDRGLLTAFAELAALGPLADVGCGPGHVTRFLAARHPHVIGIDLSPAMVAIARQRTPELTFTVASMLRLPVVDGVWAAGAVALYSIIYLTGQDGRSCPGHCGPAAGCWLRSTSTVPSSRPARSTTSGTGSAGPSSSTGSSSTRRRSCPSCSPRTSRWSLSCSAGRRLGSSTRAGAATCLPSVSDDRVEVRSRRSTGRATPPLCRPVGPKDRLPDDPLR